MSERERGRTVRKMWLEISEADEEGASSRYDWFVAWCLARPAWLEQIQWPRLQRISGESRAGICRGMKETSEEWCLQRWAMYFVLDPESHSKSTWQVGQTTVGSEGERRIGWDGRRRPRDASMGWE